MPRELFRCRVFLHQLGLPLRRVLGQIEPGARFGEVSLIDAHIDREFFAIHLEEDIAFCHALAGRNQNPTDNTVELRHDLSPQPRGNDPVEFLFENVRRGGGTSHRTEYDDATDRQAVSPARPPLAGHCRDLTEWAAGLDLADALGSDFSKSFHKVIHGSREIHADGFRFLHQCRELPALAPDGEAQMTCLFPPVRQSQTGPRGSIRPPH